MDVESSDGVVVFNNYFIASRKTPSLWLSNGEPIESLVFLVILLP